MLTLVTLSGNYLETEGRRFIAIGVNWVPARAAMQWPYEWDPTSIEADFAKMVRMRLESEGYEVTVAENVHVGTQEILKGDHELVILDLMMPEDEGFSVVRRMRRFPGRTSTPVVILTCRNNTEDVELARREHVDAYVLKSMMSEVLLDVLSRLLGDRKLRPDSDG